MISNYHTHTFRCNHASGTEREYVEEAIRAGLNVFGFADHVPYWFPGDYYSGFRMKPEETADYVSTVLSLKEEYKDKIEILLGFEMEYYPDYFEKALEIIEPYPYDYLILGQHFLDNEIGSTHVFAEPADINTYITKYVNQVIEGMKTGKYSCLAHPDAAHYDENSPHCMSELKRLCVAAKELNMPLEISMLGVLSNRWYPRESFFKIAAEVGNDVIIGCDAHAPQMVSDENARSVCENMIKKLGLHQIDFLELKHRKQ